MANAGKAIEKTGLPLNSLGALNEQISRKEMEISYIS